MTDRVVVVTGASQGIGRHIALAFGRAGHNVVAAARNEAGLGETVDLIRGAGGAATAIACDLRDPASVAALAQRAESEAGPVDAVIANSGVAGPTGELWTIDPADWDETFRVNTAGTFLTCREFLPAMIERRSGSIVVIGSMTGKRPLYGRTPYAASKMALVGLVRTLAWEVGSYGIRVNLISPGATAGPRLDGVFAGQAEARGITAEQARDEFTSASPLGRMVQPGDVAATALFLASDQAASITGEDLNVSVGQAMY